MLEIDASVISSEELLERIRRDILQKNVEDPFSQKKVVSANANKAVELYKHLEKCRENLQSMSTMHEVFDRPIVSTRPAIGWLIILVKRFIRKLTFWLWRPYWDQQNAYNRVVLNTIDELVCIHEKLINFDH